MVILSKRERERERERESLCLYVIIVIPLYTYGVCGSVSPSSLPLHIFPRGGQVWGQVCRQV